MSERTEYSQIPELAPFYFEDSYVLDIRLDMSDLVFTLDLVLTPAHPEYRPPRPNDQYCFRKGTLRFPNAQSVQWGSRRFDPAVDANGEIDYGNIDELWLEDGIYHILGSWGDAQVLSDVPIVTLAPDDRPFRVLAG